MIWGGAAGACLATCLRVRFTRHNGSCLLCWSLRITALMAITTLGSLCWSLWITVHVFVAYFANLAPSPYHPSKNRDILCRYWVGWVSPLTFLPHKGASWWPLTGFPWKLPAVRCIFAGPPPNLDGTSSQAHQLVMSLTTTGWAAWWDSAVSESATNRLVVVCHS